MIGTIEEMLNSIVFRLRLCETKQIFVAKCLLAKQAITMLRCSNIDKN